jgi:hypothetical protein
MRLRADFWVAAYLRRCNRDGVAAVLRRRGAPEAGAIFIKLDCLDGRTALFGPAPPSGEEDLDRRFLRLHAAPWIDPPDAEARLRREIGFDSDIWIVELENRAGEPLVDVAVL